MASATAFATVLLLWVVPFAIPGTFITGVPIAGELAPVGGATTGDEAATWTGGLPGVSGMTRLLVLVLEMMGVDEEGELVTPATLLLGVAGSTFWRLLRGGVSGAILLQKSQKGGNRRWRV